MHQICLPLDFQLHFLIQSTVEDENVYNCSRIVHETKTSLSDFLCGYLTTLIFINGLPNWKLFNTALLQCLLSLDLWHETA